MVQRNNIYSQQLQKKNGTKICLRIILFWDISIHGSVIFKWVVISFESQLPEFHKVVDTENNKEYNKNN